jgi:hypothetical protein
MSALKIITNPDISEIRRKAIRGNTDWMVWNDRDGTTYAARKSTPAIKRAMLDMGTAGRILLYCARSVTAMRIGWRQALVLRNNARIGL